MITESECQEQSTEQRKSIHFDWEDFSHAIDRIPTGAAPGPDSVPAIILKIVRKPMSRILCKMMKKTLSTGRIPIILKQSLIIPIHKGGSLNEAANFRPISLTSHLLKTMERVMRLNLINFLEYTKKLDPRQHGSRAVRSTLLQLLHHHDDILKALESGVNLDCIYLDFAKAYDKVDHGILLNKLKLLGITGSLGRWIMNFLQDREQKVLIKGRKSESFTLISGVPQGSVIGPLLFLIFIGDIRDGVTASILVYVDDSKVKSKIKTSTDVEHLQEDLDRIYLWERTNNMRFNGGKFLILRYGKDQDMKESTIYFTGEMLDVISQVNQCRDLGITMQDDASFQLQQQKVATKVRQKCGWILRTFYSRNQTFLRHMWNTLVQPHLDYCGQLWAPSDGGELEKQEGLMRSFTSKIPSIKHMNYWERLLALRLNSQQRRIERYRIIYTWKILEDLVPNCGISESAANERLGRLCVVPKLVGSTQVRNLRSNSFQVTGPNLFNAIPKKIINLRGIGVDEFKEHLDTYLKEIPDQPKVAGMTPTAMTTTAVPSNSLLQWIPLVTREAAWRRHGA